MNRIDTPANQLPSPLHSVDTPCSPSLEDRVHILFTRIPRAGSVKSRLAPVLTPQHRAHLQEALTLDTVKLLADLPGSVYLCYADDCAKGLRGSVAKGSFDDRQNAQTSHAVIDHAKAQLHSLDSMLASLSCEGELRSFLEMVRGVCSDRSKLFVGTQEGSCLGTRMDAAMRNAFSCGAKKCLLMGSDLPYVTPEDIESAAQLLESFDVVLGPSHDGGYWIVGLNEPFPDLFAYDRYGESGVLAHAISTCTLHGKTVGFAPDSSDVDLPADYKLLVECVKADDARIGNRTKSFVRQMIRSVGTR